jgi:hypothetical protein
MVRSKLVVAAASLSVLALGVTACGSSSPTVAPASPVASGPSVPGIPASLVGMQVEGVEVEAWPSAPYGALRLWDNGTAWSQIELAKGEFKWDNLEGALANAESKGMTDILMVLGTTPEWAVKKGDVKKGQADYPQPGAASAPANLQDWDEWVTAVVTRFKGRISSYEIWNEANLKNFYSGTPEELAEMTARAYAIIKAADPEALVVSASPALRLSARFDAFYPKYLAALAKADWPVDVISLHAYPSGDGSPQIRGGLIETFKSSLAEAGAPADIPIWDTELNYGLAGPGDIAKTDITGPAAAGWIVRTYIDNLRYGIERAYWYIWTQKPYPLLGIQAYPGSDGEQGFFAIDNWVVGSQFEGCTDTAGAVTCNFVRDGQKSIVAWAETGDAPYTAPAGSQLVCDPLANCQEIAEGAAITLTEVPVRIYVQG